MFRKLSNTANSLAMAVARKASGPGGSITSVAPDLSRPDPISWSPSELLTDGPGPVPQFTSRKTCNFIVTHVPAVGFVYGQPDREDVRDQLEVLLNEIDSFEKAITERGSQPPLLMEDIKVNGHYCVRADDGFHRCEVMQKLDNGRLKLFLLDHGSYEIVYPSNLFKLPPELENKRIFLQCLILKDVDIFFEEQCEGNRYRRELLDWFRDRLSGQCVLAANVEDNDRSLICLKECNINDEVRRKALEFSVKFGPSSVSSNGSLVSLPATAPASPVVISSGRSPRLAPPPACITPPLPTITLDEVSFDGSSVMSANVGGAEFFDHIHKAVNDVKLDRARERSRRNVGALLFNLEKLLRSTSSQCSSDDIEILRELAVMADRLETLVSGSRLRHFPAAAQAAIGETLLHCRKSVALLADPVKGQFPSAERMSQDAAEVENLWTQFVSDCPGDDHEDARSGAETSFQEMMEKYRAWSDERDHQVMDAKVETKKCLSTLCGLVENTLESIVQENGENESGKAENHIKANGGQSSPSVSKQIEEEQANFIEAIRREKALLQKSEPDFMPELRRAVDREVVKTIGDWQQLKEKNAFLKKISDKSRPS